MRDRSLFQITPVGPRWYVLHDGETILTVETKHDALVEARVQTQEAQASKLVVETADGKIEDETTYDAAPFPLRC